MPSIVPNPPLEKVLARRNASTVRVACLVLDDSLQPVDPTNITYTLAQTADDTELFTETVDDSDWTAGTRIIRSGVGSFYAFLTVEETEGSLGILNARWGAEVDGALLEVQLDVEVVTGREYYHINAFRNLIDKARQEYDETPNNPMYTGYSDAHLYEYLYWGLSLINGNYQPPISWASLGDFPGNDVWVLYEAALYAGLRAQYHFWVAAELDSFADLGGSWAVTRSSKIASDMATLKASLDRAVPEMKRKYYVPGRLYRQISRRGPYFSAGFRTPGGAQFWMPGATASTPV